jgi:CubicO group peptidase (beta-lactamase class C family)
MRTARKHILIATCLLAAVAVRADELAARLDECMSGLAEQGRFSGSVLVGHDGRVLLAKGYGFANLELDVPNTPQTKFRLGSITKQFTAMAFMQLEEQGKLKVEDPISKHVPQCPEAWQKITIHHLLTHTSSIPDFTSFPDYVPTMNQRSPVSITVERFKNKPLNFTPGEKYQYSNSGYVLLGYILEKVTGQEYGDYVEQHIFRPLGMRDSGYDSFTAIFRHRASGYMRRGGQPVNAQYIDMTIPHAAGGLYSTVEDLYRWDQALYTDKLVSKKSLERIFSPFKSDYAYGWIVTKRDNRRYIGHGGGINGFSTSINRYPDDKVCIIVLSNMEGSVVGTAARELAAIVLGEKATGKP